MQDTGCIHAPVINTHFNKDGSIACRRCGRDIIYYKLEYVLSSSINPIQRLNDLKTKFETNIQIILTNLYAKFKSETGVTVNAIEVNMMDITCLSDSSKQTSVGSCFVKLHI